MNKWPRQKKVPLATTDPRNIPGIFFTEGTVKGISSFASKRNIPNTEVVAKKDVGNSHVRGFFSSFRSEYTLPVENGKKKRSDMFLGYGLLKYLDYRVMEMLPDKSSIPLEW